MTFRKTLFALAISLPGLAQAVEFKPALDAKAAWEYSSFTGGDGSNNAPGTLMFIPLLGFGKSDFLAPVMLLDYKTREKIIDEDNEPFTDHLLAMAKPVWKHKFGDSGWSLNLHGLAKRNVYHEYYYPWSLGIYDNEEFGTGLKLGLPFLKEILQDSSVGLQWSRRTYVNYHFRAPEPSGKNYYIKDAEFWKLDLGTQLLASSPIQSKLNYSYSQRNYVDAFVYPKGGVLTEPLDFRVDQFHFLDLDSSKMLNPKWKLGLDLEANMNLSNQNYNETTAIYNANYYSYATTSIEPNITWLIQGTEDGHSVKLSYTLMNRNWMHRLIRNPDGTQTEGTQADLEHDINLHAFYAYNKMFGAFFDGLAELAHSNQAYEPLIKYSYDIYHLQLGLNFKL